MDIRLGRVFYEVGYNPGKGGEGAFGGRQCWNTCIQDTSAVTLNSLDISSHFLLTTTISRRLIMVHMGLTYE